MSSKQGLRVFDSADRINFLRALKLPINCNSEQLFQETIYAIIKG